MTEFEKNSPCTLYIIYIYSVTNKTGYARLLAYTYMLILYAYINGLYIYIIYIDAIMYVSTLYHNIMYIHLCRGITV